MISLCLKDIKVKDIKPSLFVTKYIFFHSDLRLVVCAFTDGPFPKCYVIKNLIIKMHYKNTIDPKSINVL